MVSRWLGAWRLRPCTDVQPHAARDKDSTVSQCRRGPLNEMDTAAAHLAKADKDGKGDPSERRHGGQVNAAWPAQEVPVGHAKRLDHCRRQRRQQDSWWRQTFALVFNHSRLIAWPRTRL